MANDPLPMDDDDEVYEPIDPEEVDFVLAGLRDLIRKVASATIRDLLVSTRQDIACLIEEESDDDEAAADADEWVADFDLVDDEDDLRDAA